MLINLHDLQEHSREMGVIKEQLRAAERRCRELEDKANGFRYSFENSQQGFQLQKEEKQQLTAAVEQLNRDKTELLAVIQRLKHQLAYRDEQLNLYSETLKDTKKNQSLGAMQSWDGRDDFDLHETVLSAVEETRKSSRQREAETVQVEMGRRMEQLKDYISRLQRLCEGAKVCSDR